MNFFDTIRKGNYKKGSFLEQVKTAFDRFAENSERRKREEAKPQNILDNNLALQSMNTGVQTGASITGTLDGDAGAEMSGAIKKKKGLTTSSSLGF